MARNVRRWLLFMAVIGLMTLIFAFSAQPGSASTQMTEDAVMPFAELVASFREGSDLNTVLVLFNFFGTIVRKTAHLCEYALLGLLLHLLLRSWGQEMKWLPILVGIAYAVSDEVHQAFVPGRLGSPTDVLIDAVGVIAGVYAIPWIQKLRRK